VILRYSSLYTIAYSSGAAGTTATDGVYKVTTITASGLVSWS
jgi:hypothetical protein